MSFVYLYVCSPIGDSLRHQTKSCTEASCLPLSQAARVRHPGWARPCRDSGSGCCCSGCCHRLSKGTARLIAGTFVQHCWNETPDVCLCKVYLLRNSLWECDISHDRATLQQVTYSFVCFFSHSLEFLLFLETTFPINYSGLSVHAGFFSFVSVTLWPLDKSLLVFLFYYILT